MIGDCIIPRTYESFLRAIKTQIYMDVSENNGTPKSSILIGFSIINHPFWGTPIFGNTDIDVTLKEQVNTKETQLCLLHSFNQGSMFIRLLHGDDLDLLFSFQIRP